MFHTKFSVVQLAKVATNMNAINRLPFAADFLATGSIFTGINNTHRHKHVLCIKQATNAKIRPRSLFDNKATNVSME